MKFMRVCLYIIVVAVLAAIIGWNVAPSVIGSTLSKKMGVDVKIGDFDLTTKQMRVDFVQIGNPKGSTLPKALSVDEIRVNAPLTNYMKDAIVIDEVILDDVYLSLEIATPASIAGNWGKIIDNMNKSSGPSEPETKSKDEKGTSVLIKKLILTNVNVEVVNGLMGNSVTKLDTIKRLEFDNVSSDSGVPIEQIIALIMAQTVKGSVGSILEKVIPTPKGLLEKIPVPF